MMGAAESYYFIGIMTFVYSKSINVVQAFVRLTAAGKFAFASASFNNIVLDCLGNRAGGVFFDWWLLLLEI